MADISIPGTELEAAHAAMVRVVSFIDSERIPGDLDSMLGPGPLAGAARQFDSRWGDGRFQLKKQCTEIRKAIDQVLQGFGETDANSAAALEGGR